jgi:hypothetical protein
MLSIILYLWGKTGPAHRYSGLFEYGPEHVSAMAAGIRKNLRREHEIVVVSDHPAELFDSSLRYVALNDHFAASRKLGGCYLRLQGFDPVMSNVLGERCAWIDLDSVICGPLDPLFADDAAPLKLLKLDSVPGTPWNGSVVMWSPKDTGHLWHEFVPGKSQAEARSLGFKGTDQAYLSMKCGPRTPHWTYADGILHYDLHCGRRKPDNARLITFPGRAKPGTPYLRRRSMAWLDELIQSGEAATVGAVPWDTVPTKSGIRRNNGRPTLQDLRRTARAQQKLAGLG